MKDLVKLIDVTILMYEHNTHDAAIVLTYSLPLKIGFPPSSSARIHPTDHTSIAVD
jgi:hypothetical protein